MKSQIVLLVTATMLLIQAQSTAQLCTTAFDVGAPNNSYISSMVRGYHFTAPVNFTICELYVPDNLNTQEQHVEVVKFDVSAPPAYAGTTNAFTSLFNQTNWVPNTHIPCNITINAGDIIGVYGARGNTATMYNSYGTPNYATSISGMPVTIQRSGMQFTLNGSTMHDIWSEVNYNISRIQFWYNPVPLPVELVSFTGVNEDDINVLNWVTATEQNNDHFLLERSSNNSDFEEIGRVIGAGNSTSELSYSFRDQSPASGINYYRLKQVDYDGEVETYSVIAIDNSVRTEIGVFPNPAKDFITISLPQQPFYAAQITIKDAVGKTVLSTSISEKEGIVNVNSLPQGLYVVESNTNGILSTQKFVKK